MALHYLRKAAAQGVAASHGAVNHLANRVTAAEAATFDKIDQLDAGIFASKVQSQLEAMAFKFHQNRKAAIAGAGGTTEL